MFESISWVTRVTPSNTANVIGLLKRSNKSKAISEACNLKSILPSDPSVFTETAPHWAGTINWIVLFVFSSMKEINESVALETVVTICLSLI